MEGFIALTPFFSKHAYYSLYYNNYRVVMITILFYPFKSHNATKKSPKISRFLNRNQYFS